MTPETALLEAMQQIALDAYGSAPLSFAADLYSIVFGNADMALGDTLVTPATAARIRDLAERSDSWWVRGTGFPTRITLAAAHALYRDGIAPDPDDVRVQLLALGERLEGSDRELARTAAAMLERLVERRMETGKGLRLVR